MERLPPGWRNVDDDPEEDDRAVDPSDASRSGPAHPFARDDGAAGAGPGTPTAHRGATAPGGAATTGSVGAFVAAHHAALVFGGLALAIAAAALLLLGAGTPQATVVVTGGGLGADGGALLDGGGAATIVASSQPSRLGGSGRGPGPIVPAQVVVDVGGAVLRPGVYALAGGSRLADALRAAGGFSPAVDVAAAEQMLNLASPLSDGLKVRVPALWDHALPDAATGSPDRPAGVTSNVPATAPGGTATPGGLIDINQATAAELDALPGIGPVTAAKIIAARTERPFGSVQELDDRNVVGPSVLAGLRDLVTVTP